MLCCLHQLQAKGSLVEQQPALGLQVIYSMQTLPSRMLAFCGQHWTSL